ncbi:unnamed protein product (macronuclear) [Paramecium tetraurelia]|uniref:PH domain-containing protein n=1 Tax=Paramecium tetraurelia TaxID=5888 RepID=A0DRX3_PARTE|nr:uncharacterized protein GSPATT00019494001 [Paramecium tetraurelia]CAK85790.1 unnamed protein product [Paramecium tetraurelia]|eukprot:XP_001453187.1 hypothetical protein (macronuclear) [Paramecium tetraurelia strain d4-2]
MIPNIDFDQNKSVICQVEIWTPKNCVKASEKLMHGVISTLQNQQKVLYIISINNRLEHANQKERVLSLLCSSLAWLGSLKQNSSNSEQFKTLKIVYASPEENQLKQAEGYLQKTIYRPKFNYFKNESGIAEIQDCNLIFVTYENLLSCRQGGFNNSILIFDNYPCFQIQKRLTKISTKTIQNSLVELNQFNNFKSKDTSILDTQWVELSRNVMESFSDYLKEKTSQEILQRLVECYKFKQYKKSFNEYANSCQEQLLRISSYLKESNTLKLTSLIDWLKFIQIVQEWDKNKQGYDGNYQLQMNTSKKQTTLYLYLNYYSQYVLDHLEKLKFQSIIISSQSQFSPQDNFLNNIQIKHKIDQSEYFQTFYIQSNDKWVSLYNTLIKVYKVIPNSIVVIFKKLSDVKIFHEYCETQKPNILKEIDKHKILFWGNSKYDQKIFISLQREGAIWFDTYQGISKKKLFKSTNSFQFCNGLILVDMNQPTSNITSTMNLQYFKNRFFNNLIEKVLLHDNKNRVLIILDMKEELQKWMKTCNLYQVNFFEASSPFLFEMIEKNFKDPRFNQIQIENDVNFNNVQQTLNQLENLQELKMEEESEDSSFSQSSHNSIDKSDW